MKMIKLTYNDQPTIFFANPNGSLVHKDKVTAKFNRVGKLAKAWPTIEDKITKLLDSKYSREAYICLLMAKTGIRIGNLDSAEGYVAKVKGHEGELVQTYGATTLKNEHVSFSDSKMVLDFVGKKVVDHTIVIEDPVLVSYGIKFFNEAHDTWLNVEDNSVIRFIKKKIDKRLSPKDFRTFAGNCKAFQIYEATLQNRELPETKGNLNKEIKEVLVEVAEFLGNTPGVCKSAYLSPLFMNHIETERGSIVKSKEIERAQKKEAKEAAWKQMNEDRVSQGLPRKYKRRKTVKK